MSIFHKVTLEILKKNKTRTIVTIIGIILSASMFTAVTATISTMQNYMVQNAVYNEGDWHVSVTETDAGFFDFLKNPVDYMSQTEDVDRVEVFAGSKIESYVYNQQLGYAYAEGCTNEYKPYLYVIGTDKRFCETMPVHLTGGRLPEKSDEILLPEHLASNGEVYYKVGDVITLELGNRVSDGYTLGQHNPYLNAEAGEPVEGSDTAPQQERENIEVVETRTYTVVGFYERPDFENYSAPGYTAITVMDKVRPEGALYNFYFKLDKPKLALEWFGYLPGASYNSPVLTYLGVSDFAGFYTVLYGLAAILCGLIMFGSVSLIYNAFSISVSERTKQFGLLSSIGATRKQLRQMVLFEAMFVSCIGIPLGILAGVGGMGVTFHFIGKAFSTLTDYAVPLTLCVYPVSIVAACLITLITVLISAWIPSKRATMVTAVEAIRQSGDVKLSRREQKKLRKAERTEATKTSIGEKLAYRFFGLPGMIADKYYKRSRKKYRTTIVSLFMSIVLFVSASAFTGYLTDSIESGFEKNGYDISYYYDPAMYMTEEEIENGIETELISQQELSSLFNEAEGVTNATYVAKKTARVIIAQNYLSNSYLDYLNELKALHEAAGNEFDISKRAVFVCAVFVEDSVYEEFLAEHKLDKNTYMDVQNPKGVAVDGNTFFDYDLQKYVTSDILKSETAEIVIDEVNDGELTEGEASITLEVGAVVKERPYFVSDAYDLSIVYPYSVRESVLQEFSAANQFCDHFILSDDHKASYEAMKNIVVEQGLQKGYLADYAESVEENRTLVLIVNVFSYGFIVLISLIAAANVFNTVSTNISLRRREFAMLKSVGMSNKEMSRMMNFECVLYGSRALLLGLPVSALITWFIYRVISEGFTTGYYLPWGAMAVAVFSVFAVVFATMLYSMRKIQSDNPVEALKNENL